MKIGNLDISNCKIGSVQVSEVRIGSTLIWQNVPALDPDAVAFLSAAGITDPTIESAVNTLVVDLKGYLIWTKMKAIYPFVGGTALKHSYNLKNSAQYQITWSGGFTNNNLGVTGNGTNGFGNTSIVPSTVLTNNSLQVSVYSRLNNQKVSTEIGCSTASFLPIIGLTVRSTANQAFFDGYDYSAHRILVSNTDSRGLFTGSITSSTSQNLYRNAILLGTSIAAQTQSQPTVRPLYLFARNDAGTATNYSNRNLAFASIGDGLTGAEVANLYTAVQAFNTTLSRQV